MLKFLWNARHLCLHARQGVISIKNFIERWLNRGDEKSDTQKFWLEFLRDVLNAENPTELIDFEKRVELAHKSFIDGYIKSTRVLIEQKSFDVNLDKAAKQSDGTFMTPFEQAKRYSDWLPDSERARWIIFQEFCVHDMEHPKVNGIGSAESNISSFEEKQYSDIWGFVAVPMEPSNFSNY